VRHPKKTFQQYRHFPDMANLAGDVLRNEKQILSSLNLLAASGAKRPFIRKQHMVTDKE
jgi:hypothetical protein